MIAPLLLALAAQAPAAPGPVYVRVPSTTARGCPDESCVSAGPLGAGELLRLLEIRGEWGRCSAASGLLSAWVPLGALAAGVPERREATFELALHACPEATCRITGSLKPGDEVLLVDDAGPGGALVAIGGAVGYVLDRAALVPPTPRRVAPVPAPEPPRYLPPAEAPRYIPPAVPPRYVPPAAPPAYAPPARPAALRDDPSLRQEGVRYVRRARVTVSAVPGAAEDGPVLPGGARLYALREEGGWVEVSASPGRTAGPLGWIRASDLRDLPPLSYRVRVEEPTYRPCLEKAASCDGRRARGVRAGDTLVAIDEGAGGKHLCLLPGSSEGAGWVSGDDLQ